MNNKEKPKMIKRIKEEIKKYQLAAVKQMLTLATSGFGLVAALAWNELIRTFINDYIRTRISVGSAIMAVHAIYIPMLFLCGAIIPVEALPRALQIVARGLPLTYFVGPFRSVMVEGTGLAANGNDLLILLAWMVGSWIVAVKIFRWE